MGVFDGVKGLSPKQAQTLERNLEKAGGISVREYGRREVVLRRGEDPGGIGILQNGLLLLESVNLDGQRRIMDYYGPGDLFWKRSLPDLEKGVYYVIAGMKSRIAFVDDQKMSAAYGAHGLRAVLLDHMLKSAQERALIHIDILGQRSLRQKLNAFFTSLNREQKTGVFLLPFSMTDCADYLGADRSAMMRELGRMKTEGLVKVQGRRIELCGKTGQEDGNHG